MAPRPDSVLVDAGVGDLWSGIERALARHHPAQGDVERLLKERSRDVCEASVLIMGRRTVSGLPADLLVRQVRSVAPHLHVCVVLPTLEGQGDRLHTLAWAGGDDAVALATGSDFDALARLVAKRLQLPAPEGALRELSESVAALHTRTLALFCVRNGCRLEAVERVSLWFQTPASTIGDELRKADLPPTGLLSRSGLHLHATELKRRGVRPRSVVARRLGFETTDALARARQRTVRHLRRLGRRGELLLSLLL